MTRGQAIKQAEARMRASVPFYPQDEVGAAEVLLTIHRMCETADQIQWLATMVINTWEKWEGIAGLRRLYASRFRPQDGISADTTDRTDGERAFLEQQGRLTAAKIANWKRDLRREGTKREVIPIWSDKVDQIKG